MASSGPYIPLKGGYIRPQSSICSVFYNDQTGTGALYELLYPENTMRTLFITNFHVLKMTNPSQVTGLKLVFQENSIGNVNMTPDWVKILWTSPENELDVTIIELSPIAMKVLSRTKFVRLVAAAPREKEQVSVYQYPGGVLSVGIGSIISIEAPIIKYTASTESGSSGSPVLNYAFNVVAIHTGTWTEEDIVKGKFTYEGIRTAIHMNMILEKFKTELFKRYGGYGQMANLIALEWIDQIPRNALQFLGAGGYGKVYKAILEVQSNVAVKIIEGFGGLDKYTTQVDALSKEYQLITSLRPHPRKILWYSFVRDDQNAKIFIVMEYLEGGSLFDKIKNYGRLNKTCALKYLIQILEGLQFLHEQNVFHNDLKPANILFTAEDDIKLCDFGISTQLHTDSSITSPHLRQDCYYMSPERITGEPSSALSDMWSLGVTFVMMLTGHTINHTDRFPIVNQLIADFPRDNNKVTIDGVALGNSELVSKNDYRRLVISKTLCSINDRQTAHSLLQQLCPREDPASSEVPSLGIGHGIMPTLAAAAPSPNASSQAAISKSPEVNAWRLLKPIHGFYLKFNNVKDEQDVHLVGMAGGRVGSSGNVCELFIADSENRVVRSINLCSDTSDDKLNLQHVYRMLEGENLKDIDYFPKTDTLLVVSSVPNAPVLTIRSLARPASATSGVNYGSDWHQCCSHPVKSKAQENRCTLRALSDGRLVFGVWGAFLVPADPRSRSRLPTQTPAVSCHKENTLGDVLQVLTLDTSRQIQEKSCIKLLVPHSGFDAKLGNKGEMWVAAALWFDTVALFRVDGESAKELSRFTCEYAQIPLFLRDRESLLVCQWPDSASGTLPEVQELSVSGGRLAPLRKLGCINNSWFSTWCTVPQGIVAWGFDPTLNLYSP